MAVLPAQQLERQVRHVGGARVPQVVLGALVDEHAGLLQRVGAGDREQLRQRLGAGQGLSVDASHAPESHPLEAAGQAQERDLGLQALGHASVPGGRRFPGSVLRPRPRRSAPSRTDRDRSRASRARRRGRRAAPPRAIPISSTPASFMAPEEQSARSCRSGGSCVYDGAALAAPAQHREHLRHELGHHDAQLLVPFKVHAQPRWRRRRRPGASPPGRSIPRATPLPESVQPRRARC